MSEVLGRIRGGVHAAVSHDSAIGHVTGAARITSLTLTQATHTQLAAIIGGH